MSNRIYVGNLAFAVTESEVNDLFRQYGTIDSCQLVIDRDSGRSKGFAFVEMSSKEEADDAIDKLSNHEMDGRTIVVNEARPRTQNSFGSGSRGGSGGGNRFSRGGRGGY